MNPLRHPADQPANQTAADLRAEFDRTFAQPVREADSALRNFIILEVAGQTFALPAEGLSSIERTIASDASSAGTASASTAGGFALQSAPGPSTASPWVRVPSTQPALLGIRAFGGRIVPVFSLAVLLDCSTSSEATHCALVNTGRDLIGFAFDALVRFIRTPAEQLFAPAATARPWEAASLSDAGEVIAVLSIPALLTALATQQPQNDQNPAPQNGQS